MMKIFFFNLFSVLLSVNLSAQTAKEILKESDERIRGVQSSYSELIITVVRPKWSKEMMMKGWSLGTDYFVSVVTAPAKEKGVVFLKRDNEVWNYLPSIERTIKLPPSMMMQNWMGTDFTNDDLVKRSSTVEDYSQEIVKEETYNDLDCWVLELIPQEDAAIVWGKLIMWIDKEDYMQLKTEFYDEYGDMVSIMESKNYKKFGNKILPSLLEYIPLDKDGHKTIVEYVVREFNLSVASRYFVPSNMKNLR